MKALAAFFRRLLRLARRQARWRRRFCDARSAINCLVLDRGGERYVFLWDDEHDNELMRTAGRFAIDDRLNFTWRDAGIVAERLATLSGWTDA